MLYCSFYRDWKYTIKEFSAEMREMLFNCVIEKIYLNYDFVPKMNLTYYKFTLLLYHELFDFARRRSFPLRIFRG